MIEVRPCASLDEVRRAFVIWHYFGAEATEEDAQRLGSLMGPGRMLAAWDGQEVVGGAGAFPFELTVPGGRTVPAAGITVVGVLPTHRRRGVLTKLMRAQLDDVRRRGEPVAYLWASEGTIYGRFGYGMASLQGGFRLPRERTAFAEPAEPVGRVRLVSAEEAYDLFPRVYDRVRVQRPGMFARTRDWWEVRTLGDTPARRGSAGPLQRVVLELDGEVEAYAAYRVQQSFEASASNGSIQVVEAIGATPAATRAIWRFLLDIDWTSRIEAQRLPLDHELFHLLAEPRRLRFELADALWVRLVDVEAALAARAWGAGEVVLDVHDAFCPWNEGCWRVGAGGVERTDEPGELGLDAAALGALYLGGFSVRQLADAGRVEELADGAVERADAVFARDRAPWCPEIF